MKIFSLLFLVLFKGLNAKVIPSGEQGLGSRNDTKFWIMSISPIWLKELENTYKSGFPKNFGFTIHRNMSNVPNHNVPSGGGSTCQNVTFCSVEQNRRLVNKYGWNSVFNSTTQEMLRNPRARLYSYQGDTEDYRFLRSERLGMCTNLKNLRRRVESVFTFGKCIRLFEYQSCEGLSLAVYPGSRNSEKLMGPRGVTFQAIGPCLQNEFASGGFNDSFPTLIFKNPEFLSFNPDLAHVNPKYADSGFKIFEPLLYSISFSPENKIEQIRAGPIHSQYLQQSDDSRENGSFHKTSEEVNSDIVGYAIPRKFGGTSEAFNQFPASPSSLIRWDNVLSGFMGNHSLFVHLKFEYENQLEIRPLYFYYSIKIKVNLSDDDNISKWYYGRIINEHPTKLKRDQPYVQDIDQRKVTKKNLHYIHMNFSPVFQSLESSDFNKFPGSNYNNVAGNRMPSVLNCQQVISSDEDSAEHNGLNKRSMKKHEEFMDPLTWDVQKITEMLHNPMVRLFTGANFSGTFENYHSGMERNYSGCHDTRQVRSVKSAATLNKCTRLFTLKDCRGLSLAIYPGLGNSNVPLDILSQVMSIGPCIVEDFVENKNTSGAIPDIFAISETPTSNSDLYRGDRLEVQYTLGPKNRIENLVASIFQPGLVDITEFLNVEETNFYKSRDTEPGDIPNFVIPIEIGGPQDFLFNIFPMHQSMVNTWAEIFPSSFSDPNEIFHWHMSFKFVYDTDSHTRPMYVYYYFRNEIHKMIYYARFVNS